jgi:GT2 family glycosyltransferase
VNWNTGAYLRRCLESIRQSDGLDLLVDRVTVVDNASQDGSIDGLDDIELPLEIIRNSTNIGFGAACNQGAGSSRAEYVLFLNPDTTLLRSTLPVVTSFMSAAPAEIGICGVTVAHADGSHAISCARFPTLRVLTGKLTGLDRLLPRMFPPHHLAPAETDTSCYVDQVIGAFFLVRRSLFDELNGFDGRFFLYYEEVDFSKRASSRGRRSYLLTETSVGHAENVSTAQAPVARLYHSLRSRRLYALRHWNMWQASVLLVVTLVLEFPARLVRDAARGGRLAAADVITSYRLFVLEVLGRHSSIPARVAAPLGPER